jgi:quercetin dioxygenase-like cupin family protein
MPRLIRTTTKGRTMRIGKLMLAVASAALLSTIGIRAAEVETPLRHELKRTDLAGVPGMEVVESITEYKPGDKVPLHLHHGVEAGYVVQGTMVQVTGKDPSMMETGSPILNLRDVKHGGYVVVGPGSLKLFTVHIVDKGKPLYDDPN